MVVSVILMQLKGLVLKSGHHFRKKLVDGIFTVADKDAFNNVKLVANKEGLLVGSSSGAALQGALELKSIQNGVIVTIFPDGSDRYMSKQIFNYKESFNNE